LPAEVAQGAPCQFINQPELQGSSGRKLPCLLRLLHQELPTEVIYEGNPVDPSILEAAGIREVHAVAAVTSDDSTNLAICFLSKAMFEVPRTIARVNNPNNAWLFNEKFDVDVALNPADVLAHLIEEEMSLGDMMTLFKIRRGSYAVVEEKVPAGGKAIGIPSKIWISLNTVDCHHSTGK
jgi:trk system potassium uptake protein TrkA